jgi:hypothetical protein
MSQSVFEPTGPFTERSGSTFLGPHAPDHSPMPPDLVDGEVDQEEAAELERNLEQPAAGEPCLPGLVAPFDTAARDCMEERENTELPGIL